MGKERESMDIPMPRKLANEPLDEVWRELDRKASKEWARGKIDLLDTQMSSMKETMDEVKNLSINAKKHSLEAKNDAGAARVEALNAKNISDRAERKAKEVAMANHECIRTDTLTRMRVSIDSWTNWWRRTMITVVAAIIVFGGAIVTWLYLHKALSDDVESMKEDVTVLKDGMVRIEASQEILKNQKGLTIGDVEAAFKDAVEEIEKEHEQKGRKGRQ